MIGLFVGLSVYVDRQVRLLVGEVKYAVGQVDLRRHLRLVDQVVGKLVVDSET